MNDRPTKTQAGMFYSGSATLKYKQTERFKSYTAPDSYPL